MHPSWVTLYTGTSSQCYRAGMLVSQPAQLHLQVQLDLTWSVHA